MTIEQLVKLGLWEQFYLNKEGEKFPVTEETKDLFFSGKNTKDWSLISQKVEK